MTRAAIRELCPLLWIVDSSRFMTSQAPSHIHDLGILGNFYLGHVAMALFTIQPCRNMRPVYKVDEVWHLRDRHPGDLFIVQDIIFQHS
jgi:hypothetical protein